jgi:F0F1-type ATP synthase delta subunit
MSLREVLAHNYAKAIVKYYGDVLDEFVLQKKIIENNITFFSNPSIPLKDRVKVLKTDLEPIFKIILFKNHFKLLVSIESFLKLVLNKKNDVTHFHIESATDNISEIKKILESKYNKVIITYEINENLIAGFVLKYNDFMIDMSIRGQLEDLRNLEL